MANVRGIPHLVIVQFHNCTHKDRQGQSDCNEPIPVSSREDGEPILLSPWGMGLCGHHYIQRLREIIATRRIYRARDLRTRQIRLRLRARAMRRMKAGR